MTLFWVCLGAFAGGLLIGLAPIIPKWLELRRIERKSKSILKDMQSEKPHPSLW